MAKEAIAMSGLFGAGTISMYPTPASLGKKVDEYFDSCFVWRYNSKLGVDIPIEVKTPTYSGLARYLGFSTRGALLEFAKKRDDAYGDIIASANLRLEEYMESQLIKSKNPAGLIFALKNNAEWEDVSKKELSGSGNTPLMFGWATEAQDGDVLTIEAEKSEIQGALPPVPPKLGGTIDIE